MTPARHIACRTEVTLNRAFTNIEPGYLVFWCPTCKRAVSEKDLDVAGPYCVATDKEATNKEAAQ